MLLEGKTVLITGAARGIGRVTAYVMADEGADVGLVDILPDVEATSQEIVAKKGRAHWEVFDISDPAEVKNGVRKLVESLGEINVLVNNAGIVNNISPLTKMIHSAWEREISVNLTGAFNMIREVIEPMIEAKWGRIINVSSIGATGGLHNQVGYAASKAGLIGLTKNVAIEHGRDNITCNVILPGLIETELVREMPQEIKNNAVSFIPSRRFGRMDEAAHLIAFLASERAGYINGAEIALDGGMRLNTSSLGSRKEARNISEAGKKG